MEEGRRKGCFRELLWLEYVSVEAVDGGTPLGEKEGMGASVILPGEKLFPFLALAAPFLRLGVVKHRCLVGGTQTQTPPQLDRGEADAPH